MRDAKTLARLDAIQARSLRPARTTPSTNRALLVELLEASCLLELAKIDTDAPRSRDLPAARGRRDRADVSGAGCCRDGHRRPAPRAIDVHAGERPSGGRRYPLVTGGLTIGVLVTGAVKADLGAPDQFFDRSTAQVANGLAARCTPSSSAARPRPRTRRASRRSSPTTEKVEGLEELALSLASFPTVIAAELVDRPPRRRTAAAAAFGLLGQRRSAALGRQHHARPSRCAGRLDRPLAFGRRHAARRTRGARGPPASRRVARTHRAHARVAGAGRDRAAHRPRQPPPLAARARPSPGRAERYGENVAVLLLDLDRSSR